MYPQYAASTTASGLDAVHARVAKMRRMPALRTIDCFHDDPAYIKALAQTVNDYWMKNGRPNSSRASARSSACFCSSVLA